MEAESTDKGKLLEKAKKRFKLASESEQKQRNREKDDLQFQVPELQWDEAAKRQRLGMSDRGVPVPARPVLSISRLDQPIQMVLNQERAAHLGVSIQPISADANDDTAAILEGIYRRIERDSQAHIARSWAFSRAVKAGRGAYRVNTQYDETTDEPFDQKITIERILHQESVYFDPAAEKPDFSDGNYAFIAAWVSLSDFKAEYPDAEVSKGEAGTFADLVTAAPEWVKGDGESEAVLVVEYFYKVKKFEPVKSKDGKNQRKREVTEVKWAKLTGFEVLEEQDWNGHLIPVIPAIGVELHPFDGERRWTGIIGPAKDGQRLYNFAASSAVERVALEPKAPWIMAEGQSEGYQDMWDQANTRNFPALIYKPTTIGGVMAPPPQRSVVDSSGLSVSMQLLQQADQFIQVTTATYDPSLGRLSSREKSGKAIMALQGQGEEGNSHFMHNLADISMGYEARVILDLIPAIYDRPGRLARTLNEENKSDTVILNQPFYHDPQSKRPVPLPPGGMPPQMMGRPPASPPPGGMMPPPGIGPGAMPTGGPSPMMVPPSQSQAPPAPPEVKHYDLKRGTYSVAISIGKTRQSALQEGAEEIGQILQAMPNLGPIILPTWLHYRDFPGAKELGDLLTKVRDKQFPGLGDSKDGQPSPEQAQAKVAALEQQLQMMGAQMQAAMEAIKTEQAKQQVVLQKAQMEQQTSLAKTQMETEAKVKIAEMEQQTRVMLENLAGQLEQIKQAVQIGHEKEQGAAERDLTAASKVADLTFKAANPTPLEVNKEM